MTSLGALVPARFLALTAHLVAVLTIFWARDPHVLASLPLEFSPEEYARVDTDGPGSCWRHRGPRLLPLRALGLRRLLGRPGRRQRPPSRHRAAADGHHLGVQEETAVTLRKGPRWGPQIRCDTPKKDMDPQTGVTPQKGSGWDPEWAVTPPKRTWISKPV
ncbi:transmembrane protein 107 isoform X1 [Struthio camelus]|uniref:transmembrane protein 107 isoform X1 n=1 Tax=Struthio camelus TaxID=8801 RepID=UPI0036040A0A